MAQFMAKMQGQRGSASRLGSKSSGLTVSANGWNVGVKVEASHRTGRDTFDVYITGGSNNPTGALVIRLTEDDLKDLSKFPVLKLKSPL